MSAEDLRGASPEERLRRAQTFFARDVEAMTALWRRFLWNDDGQDVIEYALLTASIGLIGIATWPLMPRHRRNV